LAVAFRPKSRNRVIGDAHMHRYVVLPAVVLLMLGSRMACAQTTPPAAPPAQAAPSGPPACSPDARSSTDGRGQSNSNLSDRLANQNGVICPPADVDPQMRVPPPGGGRMLVVPPPGGPGGDPNTIPK
jgi:hypothetical protein